MPLQEGWKTKTRCFYSIHSEEKTYLHNLNLDQFVWCVCTVITLWYIHIIKYYVQDVGKNAKVLEISTNNYLVSCVAHSSTFCPLFIIFEIFCTLKLQKMIVMQMIVFHKMQMNCIRWNWFLLCRSWPVLQASWIHFSTSALLVFIL